MSEAKSSGTRPHDAPVADQLNQFMSTGWADSPLVGLTPAPAVAIAAERRKKLSAMYPGQVLKIEAGGLKVRSNDTDYHYRPHSAFAWLLGLEAGDATPDAVLVMQPNAHGHESTLFIRPRSTRDTEAFWRDARYGEFWVGRVLTVKETETRYAINAAHIETLEAELSGKDPLTLNDKGFETALSELRLLKDVFEVKEMQRAVDASARGFEDMVRVLPAAINHKRGERIVESAFFGRARLEGNDLGYTTIAASGSHACILHWTRNDGDVKSGDLILIDAGVEVESYYTADITRTLPVNGKFSEAQREIYMLVYTAQRAAMAAVKPGAKFKDINKAAQEVLAHGLAAMGVLPVSAEESMNPEVNLHRRWTIHGTSHMLGMDVHDCAHARAEQYLDGVLAAGMILTVEPGLYIHPDDELFPAKYRGIGVRIEDDVLVTESGFRNLSAALPAHPDEVEVWMANLLR
jgi:Xaa-Pro aminopeptidase